ncbi:MAG: radical SAM protein [Acidimicrobiia bacterium]|nr:radical SAM protein [Acidimicrobiia bacterium]
MSVAEAVAAGQLPGRVWFYSNYHCNLECTYCLTESAPGSVRRALDPDQVLRLAREAAELGFTDLGVTGGEPFLLPYLVDLLVDMSEILPTVVLSNGTVFGERRLERVRELAGRRVEVQISLDAPEADLNDELRGPENFAKVADVVPRLVADGVKVRIATTVEPDRLDEAQHARLCELHRSWGVSDDDHLVRPVISRGRARTAEMGTVFDHHQIPAELTVTVDGAFWSPFGPTMRDGRVDTDLLLTRTVEPLAVPAAALERLVAGRPPGDDAGIGIR